MTEERITTTQDDLGNTHTTHTVRDGESSGGGAFKWILLLIIILAVAFGGYILMQGNSAEIAKDNAVTEAANNVGEAAQNVGEAAQDAADSVTE